MMHVVRLKDIACEGCGRPERVICFWFDKKEEDDDYRQATQLDDFSGEFIKIQNLGDFWVGYYPHQGKKGKIHNPCAFSEKAPKRKDILQLVADGIKEERRAEHHKMMAILTGTLKKSETPDPDSARLVKAFEKQQAARLADFPEDSEDIWSV